MWIKTVTKTNPFTSERSNPPINTQNQAEIGVVLRQTSRALPEVRFLTGSVGCRLHFFVRAKLVGGMAPIGVDSHEHHSVHRR
jgi:hypothetical protein